MNGRFAVYIDIYGGPWVSFGAHIDFGAGGRPHIDLHIGWALISIGWLCTRKRFRVTYTSWWRQVEAAKTKSEDCTCDYND